MVNSQTIKEIVSALKLDLQTDIIPNAVPVVEVNPRIVKPGHCRSTSSTVTGTVSISSATLGGVGKDVYITGIHAGVSKNAACDVATGTITIALSSAETNSSMSILHLPVITLTAEDKFVSLDFEHPIRLLRDSAISMTATFTAGILVKSFGVRYFIDDVS